MNACVAGCSNPSSSTIKARPYHFEIVIKSQKEFGCHLTLLTFVTLDGMWTPLVEDCVMGYRSERRKFPRFEISFPITFRLFRGDTPPSDSQFIEAIGTSTRGRVGNVSLEGLFIEANPTEDQVSEIMRAKQARGQFDIEIETRLMGEDIRLMGRVVWYDIILPKEAPYYLRAGVFLGELDSQNQEVWNSLISTVQE
jgi:hypothetical protein